MEDNKLFGAKQAVQDMLYYYFISLLGKTDDPKQVMATEIPKMINLSEEQAKFIILHLSTDTNALKSLESSVQLLETIHKNKKYDEESIDIILKSMQILLEQYKNTINIFLDENMDFEGENFEQGKTEESPADNKQD